MPYKSERIKIEGTVYDRRRKLTEVQKEEIRLLRRQTGLSYNKIAERYGVSKRMIMFVVDPEKYAVAREQFKERQREGRYQVSREERASIVREHRRYKQGLHKEGKI